MSDAMHYGISLSFQKAITELNKFKKSSERFNKAQENALKTQIKLAEKLKKTLNQPVKLQAMQVPSTGKFPKGSPTTKPIPTTPSIQGPVIDSSHKKFLKDQAKMQRRSAEQAERQAKALQEAKTQIMTTSYMLKRNLSTSEKETREAIKLQIATAKTGKEVRSIYRFHKNNTAQLQKQQFLMRRMQQSSEQFAGNMVSAFAIASGGAAITRVGQDFEAVNNTMLAVSESSEQAGQNFSFVKDEAFRLGLGLKESAKGFAKMVSARGEMSLEDTKEVFTGVSEMGTLLGLSAEESGRATNAVQQMMSKTVVSAEELNLGSL